MSAAFPDTQEQRLRDALQGLQACLEHNRTGDYWVCLQGIDEAVEYAKAVMNEEAYPPPSNA